MHCGQICHVSALLSLFERSGSGISEIAIMQFVQQTDQLLKSAPAQYRRSNSFCNFGQRADIYRCGGVLFLFDLGF